ncbi:hypothetical protein VF14_12195 [Nostoc linckia z18]|uniref:Lysozyme family protein n=2 Tax=Nostoc linckia TaxID=92942 RepID=A0A9Q6EKQ5_NOSLI|nr:hypothetical protein [Nostoc linckia]PHK31328.1 hypothetical protein VF12_28270 [Nostoc linckia z15]PHK47843.1 hypothetical protein VF13_03205 [Nostoc linckia z16]PHJ57767.1 hypothetical protein VF02_29350 [Nostoc linckia z1]PHJ60277.1 hypothetical protein VF05_30725 [Nostoc linckia z3]PHJ76667.1 hypothetical protein VF06_31230 [Nostoc linckia z4]
MANKILLSLVDLKPEYQKLWDSCEIKPDKLSTTQNIVAKISGDRLRYEVLQQKINVPWYFVAVIHNMESSLNFTKHLHNGDSLKKRTINEPSGRPLADPIKGWQVGYTWEESAIDALTMKEFNRVKDWSLPAQLWQLERYNGFGYRKYHPEVLTPYLWSGTNHYSKGKYVTDGKWDANAISEQIGIAALLKVLIKEANINISEGVAIA